MLFKRIISMITKLFDIPISLDQSNMFALASIQNLGWASVKWRRKLENYLTFHI